MFCFKNLQKKRKTVASSQPLPDLIDPEKLEENKEILNPLKSTQTTQGNLKFIGYCTNGLNRKLVFSRARNSILEKYQF